MCHLALLRNVHGELSVLPGRLKELLRQNRQLTFTDLLLYGHTAYFAVHFHFSQRKAGKRLADHSLNRSVSVEKRYYEMTVPTEDTLCMFHRIGMFVDRRQFCRWKTRPKSAEAHCPPARCTTKHDQFVSTLLTRTESHALLFSLH